MLPNTCHAARTALFCSGHTHPPQQFPMCCLHPTHLLLSQYPKKLNNCQSHEQAVFISRLSSTTSWCLQLQLNVMQKEEKAGTSSHFFSSGMFLEVSHLTLDGAQFSLAPDQSWELNSIKSNSTDSSVQCSVQSSLPFNIFISP